MATRKSKSISPSTHKKPIRVRKISYHVYELSDEGHLQKPKDYANSYSNRSELVFSYFGYDTIEEAYEAIENEVPYGTYIVLPQITIDTDFV
jgi:hypothetical protein